MEILIVAIAMAILMAGLLGMTVLWTIGLKIAHPDWSWRKCAKRSTLIS